MSRVYNPPQPTTHGYLVYLLFLFCTWNRLGAPEFNYPATLILAYLPAFCLLGFSSLLDSIWTCQRHEHTPLWSLTEGKPRTVYSLLFYYFIFKQFIRSFIIDMTKEEMMSPNCIAKFKTQVSFTRGFVMKDTMVKKNSSWFLLSQILAVLLIG